MKYETLEIQIENDVATIYLNRPEVHNAMNEKLMKELTTCFLGKTATYNYIECCEINLLTLNVLYNNKVVSCQDNK